MSRDTHEGLRSFAARQQESDGREDPVAVRLAALERAHRELQERLRRFERERAEMKLRLGRVLARMGVDLP